MLQIWFMQIFARPKKIQEPRTGCTYNDLISEKLKKKIKGVSYKTILSVLCLSEIGMRILFTWVLRNLVVVIACSIWLCLVCIICKEYMYSSCFVTNIRHENLKCQKYKKITQPSLNPNKVTATVITNAIVSTEAQILPRNWKFWVCFNFEDKMMWNCEKKR